ncbi:MAG TPA: hypothetical protein PLI10_04670 [Bacillota bacterium]|nr:hypothetical protein [Bacillota bacterium]HOS50694.1 hypothetical protein [Bacillota bacterium]
MSRKWLDSMEAGMLDKVERIARLLDLYKGIISEKQGNMCSRYFLDNLSLSEIAENEGISRQAVHDGIERGIESLEAADTSLRLIERSDRLSKIAEKINVLVASLPEGTREAEELSRLAAAIGNIFED